MQEQQSERSKSASVKRKKKRHQESQNAAVDDNARGIDATPDSITEEEISATPQHARRLLLKGGSERQLSAAVRWVFRLLKTFPVDRSEVEALYEDIESLESLQTQPRIRCAAFRSFVLLSLYLEEDTAKAIAANSEEDARYVKDMRERVLPVLVPYYIDNLAQRPDIFVGMASCLHRLWPNEPSDPAVLRQTLHSSSMSVPTLTLW